MRLHLQQKSISSKWAKKLFSNPPSPLKASVGPAKQQPEAQDEEAGSEPTPELEPELPERITTTFYRVQLGVFADRERAQDLSDELVERGYSTYVNQTQSEGQVLYRVQVGAFEDEGNARALATELEAARVLTYYAAWRSDQKMPNMKEASMAKLFASEAANRICDLATRIFGGYGYAMEYDVQRYFRDARFTLIGGGTSEILKMIIAKELGC